MALRGFRNLLRARSGTASLRPLETKLRKVRALVDDPSWAPGRSTSGADEGGKIPRLAALCRSAETHLGLAPHDEQILAALALLEGFSVDMATGEGKTLVALLAAGMYAAAGRTVHVLCPNDYLAARDHALAVQMLEPLGLATGCTMAETATAARAQAYGCSVVHSTVSEIAYDLMRDGLALSTEDVVSPVLDVALVDEVDSVLLDEATQPLVIAQTANDVAARNEERRMALLVAGLEPGRDYTLDTVSGSAAFTDAGVSALEKALGCENLYAPDQVGHMAAANAALHAHAVLARDVDYVVVNDTIGLVSPTRGRVVANQRWPEALQRAVEAKEQLTGASRVQVMDQITVQEVARSYRACLGMSATATLAADPLHERYGFLVAQVPPHRELARVDESDELYLDAKARDNALVTRVAAAQQAGRPVLVGTQSIEQSRALGEQLEAEGVASTVLNATNAAEEAAIIVAAGAPGQVTISTQMAGRGTDIVLTDRARANGGLVVIGAGRYPNSRLDAQLRGRCGRQGDPGTSVLMAALDDPLLNTGIFDGDGGREHISTDVETDGTGRILDEEVIAEVDHQQRVLEGRMLMEHEQAWQYTLVPWQQRQQVLQSRRAVLHNPISARREIFRHLDDAGRYAAADLFGERLDSVCSRIVLDLIDERWSEHLNFLTSLREGIHLRRLARLSPLAEFQREANEHYADFLAQTAEDAAGRLSDAVRDGRIPDISRGDPGSLWAYEVIQAGWGSPEDRLVEAVGRRIRSLLDS
ncbi:hypothetical protein [Propionibacterium sp.]|uniref:preprotein translocase subunit SecA n=1 Tax=Propionibacterium sp. TaxID=1977903 RepID=UPI0039EB05FC